MSAVPEWITGQDGKVARLLYACWIATFHDDEHHMGLRLAQTQAHCLLYACHNERNAKYRRLIDDDVAEVVRLLGAYRVASNFVLAMNAIELAQSLVAYSAPVGAS